MYTYEQRMDELDKEIGKQLIYCFPILLTSIAMPILALNGTFIPCNETLASWFQRSGSLSVLFAVLTEYKLFKLYKHLNPTGVILKDGYRFKIRYGFIYSSLTVSSALMALIGTFIWGYGDLFI